MPFILLTNDDGIDAPGLPSFAQSLGTLGDVEVVVPDRERSWIGKAITRFEPVRVEHVTVGDRVIHTTTGYPADCVQLGVHTLFDRKPDLVVSGINVGYNHGSAYIQSSGTVGAALEGAISGVKSVAFSTGWAGDDWTGWAEWSRSEDSLPTWTRLAEVATAMSAELLSATTTGVVNIGLPTSADLSTERRMTTVARVGYDKLFSRIDEDVYTHTFGGVVESQPDMTGTDIEAADDEVIAITPIDGTGFAESSLPLAEILLHSQQ